MSLSEVDRDLLQRCLARGPRSWNDFVDRFLGLIVHVVNHTAASRNLSLDASAREDLVSDVFLELIRDDFRTLRRFRRNCSLATYLTVIARRVVVRQLNRRSSVNGVGGSAVNGALHRDGAVQTQVSDPSAAVERDEHVASLMNRLEPQEADVVRMFHLEGKSYGEISRVTGIKENSIGPMLSRAKEKMRA